MILKRMKRRHSREDSIRFCEDVRKLRPDMAFGADLMVGFPTETDVMFENTLSVVDACGLDFLHVFPFSPREGTPAAKMPQLDASLIKARAKILRKKGDEVLATHFARMQGNNREVLMEKNGLGRLEQFTAIRVSGGENLAPGTLGRVDVSGFEGKMLTGNLSTKPALPVTSTTAAA